MTSLPQRQDEQPGKDPEQRRSLPDWAVGLLTIEAISLGIGLLLPITPSKTGSDRSLAELFIADPDYLTEVLVGFIFTNLLIGLLLLAAWVYGRFMPSDDSPAG